MFKRIGLALAAATLALIQLGAAPARSASYGAPGCAPATRPPSTLRTEHRLHGRITVKVWVAHRDVTCLDALNRWVIEDRHVREWKRYSRHATHACQVFGRHKIGAESWSSWKLVPWASSTNC